MILGQLPLLFLLSFSSFFLFFAFLFTATFISSPFITLPFPLATFLSLHHITLT
ncbi:uncharacterized protein BP01DRAFT_354970 [Aspergillus saccharolyticus JOP 1030-1]|uniref:Uncharacterized protein n=1 Tax=Aspergillus saccharolyticus JOP 1030-1 TaxID=1450539 RepID=A0A318ZI73_9EURO|nr:hypothetical protein BP01DRAFT_354970 [Aspergillus saccharolyticus JOP 1030-1]PYH47199.1 hypothetical protein BP01DRAFT_354970 [Aspergillus saccharolyticus JOP 1030-1]